MEQALMKLIEAVENSAPVVWQIAMRQVYSNVAALFLWSIAALITAFLLIRLWKKESIKTRDVYDDSFWEMGGNIFAAVGIVVSLIAGLILFTNAVQALINPQYYAIQSLLQFVK
jgi:hypothetical protein